VPDWRNSKSNKLIGFAGLILALWFHGLFLVWLLLMNFAEALAQPPVQTITVSLITPPEIKPLAPEPKPKLVEAPKPKVQPPRPKPLPVIAAANPDPAPYQVPAPAPTPPITPAPEKPAPEAPFIAPVVDAAHLSNPKPVYPMMSRRQGESGEVVLRVLIGVDGKAEEVRVRRSSGFERLDNSALDAVKKWKFVPARRGDTPVAEWWDVPVSFRLDQA
jgi:periplasmic protein TonB